MPLEVGGIFLAVHHDEEGTKIAEIAVRRPEYKASIEAKFAECRGILNDVHEAFTNEIGFFVQQGADWKFLTFVHRERIDSVGNGSFFSSKENGGGSGASLGGGGGALSASSPSAAAAAGGSSFSGPSVAASPLTAHAGGGFPDTSGVSPASATGSVQQKNSRQRGWFCVSVVFALLDPQTATIHARQRVEEQRRQRGPAKRQAAPAAGEEEGEGDVDDDDDDEDGCAPAHLQYVQSLLDEERELSRWHPVVESLAAKLIRAEAKQRFLTIALQHAEMRRRGEDFRATASPAAAIDRNNAQGLFSAHRNAFDAGIVPYDDDGSSSGSGGDNDDLDAGDGDVDSTGSGSRSSSSSSSDGSTSGYDDSADSGSAAEDPASLSSTAVLHRTAKRDAAGKVARIHDGDGDASRQQTELAWVLQGYLERISNGGGYLWQSMGNFMFVYPGGAADPRFRANASNVAASPRCSVAPSDVPLLVSPDAAALVAGAAPQGNTVSLSAALGIDTSYLSASFAAAGVIAGAGLANSGSLNVPAAGSAAFTERQQQHLRTAASNPRVQEVLHQHAESLASSADLLLALVVEHLAKARAQKAFPHVQQIAFELQAQMPLVQEAVSVLAAAGVLRVCPGLPIAMHHWSYSGWCDSIKLALTPQFYADARCGGAPPPPPANPFAPAEQRQAAFARECLAEFCRERGKLSAALGRAAATLILGPLLGSIGGSMSLAHRQAPPTATDDGGPCLSARTVESTDSGSTTTSSSAAAVAAAAASGAEAAVPPPHEQRWALQGCTSNSMRGLAHWVRCFADSVGCPLPLDGSPESALFYGHDAAAAAAQAAQQQQQQREHFVHHPHKHNSSAATPDEEQHQASHGSHQHRRQQQTSPDPNSPQPLVAFLATHLGLVLRYAFAQQWVRTIEED